MRTVTRQDGGGLNKDYAGALLLVVIGAGAAWQARSYTIGTLVRMGPGFMPAALGVLLVITGLVLFAITLLRRRPAVPETMPVAAPRKAEWRGWIAICLGVIVFAASAERVGLIPAAFACVFVSAMGDRDNRVRDAILLAAGMTIAAVGIFWWGLGVLLPLVAWDFS